jgi:hypothetical protein
VLAQSARGEKVGLRLSFNSASFGSGDVNTWVKSLNTLWADWKSAKGGSLDGRFTPLGYDPSFEAEVRVHLFSGLALNVAAGYLKSRGQGTVNYRTDSGDQKESQFLSNRITAAPLKIGLSFSYPVVSGLSAFLGFGRHMVFVNYKVRENYEARFSAFGKEFVYWYKKSNSYRSEALGYYLSLGLEYTFFRHFGLIVESEQTWSKADGFKGAYDYSDFEHQEKGKASLSYYESNEWGLSAYYKVLSGHEDRPENGAIRSLRQGKLDFSGLSFKVGLRFKF